MALFEYGEAAIVYTGADMLCNMIIWDPIVLKTKLRLFYDHNHRLRY